MLDVWAFVWWLRANNLYCLCGLEGKQLRQLLEKLNIVVSYFVALSFLLILAQSDNSSFIAIWGGDNYAWFIDFCVRDILMLLNFLFCWVKPVKYECDI